MEEETQDFDTIITNLVNAMVSTGAISSNIVIVDQGLQLTITLDKVEESE